MPVDARLLGLAGLAFVVGGLLSGALLYEGGLFDTGGASGPLVVHVSNVGSRAASAVLEVDEVRGDFHGRSELPLAAGQTREVRVDRPLSGQVTVKLLVTWSDGTRQGRGDTLALVEPGRCAEGHMFVSFDVDTTTGVAFGRAIQGCRG